MIKNHLLKDSIVMHLIIDPLQIKFFIDVKKNLKLYHTPKQDGDLTPTKCLTVF